MYCRIFQLDNDLIAFQNVVHSKSLNQYCMPILLNPIKRLLNYRYNDFSVISLKFRDKKNIWHNKTLTVPVKNIGSLCDSGIIVT